MLKSHWNEIPAGSRVSFPDTEGEIAVVNKFTIVSQRDAVVSDKNSHKAQEEQVCFTIVGKACHVAND